MTDHHSGITVKESYSYISYSFSRVLTAVLTMHEYLSHMYWPRTASRKSSILASLGLHVCIPGMFSIPTNIPTDIPTNTFTNPVINTILVLPLTLYSRIYNSEFENTISHSVHLYCECDELCIDYLLIGEDRVTFKYMHESLPIPISLCSNVELIREFFSLG